jgi:glycerophosphoryl diester phosphodiesterase
LAAFEKAIQIGVDVVEVDVHATLDNHVVVIHDATLDRTTDRTGAVKELTFDEVREADAGSWRGASFKDERVPALDEVLDLARHRALVLIEIKAEYLAERVLQTVVEMDAVSQVVIQSFNQQTLKRIKLLEPTIPAALLMGNLPTTPSRVRARKMVRDVLATGANSVGLWHNVVTPALLEEMRRRALSVWTWTVNEEVAMRDLVQMGIHGIITNYPDRLNLVLEDLEDEGLIQPPLGRRRRVKRGRWSRRRHIKKAQKKRVAVNSEP